MKELNDSELKELEGGSVLEWLCYAAGYTFTKVAIAQENYTIGDYSMMCM